MMNWFTRPPRPRRLPAAFRPALESLEERRLLAANVLQTNLVSDLPGVAQLQDPNLVNPWGISESGGSAFWISDNNAGVSTLYSQNSSNPVTINSLVVTIPTPGDPFGASGTPTGTVFNIDGGAAGGFKLNGFTTGPNGSPVPASLPAIFLFATEDGTLVGWNPGVQPQGFDPARAGTYGVIAVDNSGNNFTQPNPDLQTGAVYKAMTIATLAQPIFQNDPTSTTVLYVTNFRTGQVEAYDPGFNRINLPSGAFSDPNLPRGYSPFNIQVLGNQVYVTYARQDAARHDDVAGAGFGFVDRFNLDGSGGTRLVSRGALNAPWGLALAPSSFGTLAGSLLVGNFGDGTIHAYNASNGTPMGQLLDPDGAPIQIDGLWALRVGNGGAGGDSQTVYFTAGLDHEQHGLFGSLAPVAAGTAEGAAEAQAVQARLDVVQLDVLAVLNDVTSMASRSTLRQDLQTLDTAIGDLARAEITYFRDNHTFFQGSSDQGGATLQSIDAFFDQLAQVLDHDHDG
jgi:uncharacterized protein (TIGR03118 family)